MLKNTFIYILYTGKTAVKRFCIAYKHHIEVLNNTCKINNHNKNRNYNINDDLLCITIKRYSTHVKSILFYFNT